MTDVLGDAEEIRAVAAADGWQHVPDDAKDVFHGPPGHDVQASSFEVKVQVELPDRREAASGLRAAGLTVRDIGEALGVSFQRAQQLIAS